MHETIIIQTGTVWTQGGSCRHTFPASFAWHPKKEGQVRESMNMSTRNMYVAPGCLTCFSAQTTRCSWNCTWRWYTALSGTSGVCTGVWTWVNDMWFDDLLLKFDQRITSTQFIVAGVAGVMPLEEPGNKCLTQPTPNLFFSKMIFL